MTYLKKTMLGLKEVGKDEDYDFIAYTKSEKAQIDEQREGQKKAIKELQKAGKSNEDKIASLEEELRQLRKENMVLNAVKSNYDADIEEEKRINRDLQDMLGKEARKRYEAEALNLNLKRINKERANQDHKITPKKGKSGYKVKSSTEKVASYPIKKNKKDDPVIYNTPYWETTIITPWQGSIDFDLAKSEIEKFFNYKKNEIGIYEDVEYNEPQLKEVFKYSNCPVYNEPSENDYTKRFLANFIFYRRYQNVQGYWELVINHTLPLKDIWQLEEPIPHLEPEVIEKNIKNKLGCTIEEFMSKAVTDFNENPDENPFSMLSEEEIDYMFTVNAIADKK